ncbi:MAG: hypothetical protein ACR2FP_05800 [Nocardioidaceae bacterium]
MTDPAATPRTNLAALLVAGQAVVVLGLAVAEVVSLDSRRPSVAVTTAVFYLLFASGLAFAARGLRRQRRWSRGPVVMAQLIALGVGWSFRGGSTVWVTAVLLVWAGAVLIIVLSPTTTTALYGERGTFGDDPPPADPR